MGLRVHAADSSARPGRAGLCGARTRPRPTRPTRPAGTARRTRHGSIWPRTKTHWSWWLQPEQSGWWPRIRTWPGRRARPTHLRPATNRSRTLVDLGRPIGARGRFAREIARNDTSGGRGDGEKLQPSADRAEQHLAHAEERDVG